MTHPFEAKRTRIKWFLLANVVVAFVVSLFLCPDCLFSRAGLRSFVVDYFIFSLAISFLFGLGISRIVEMAERRVPWIRRPVLRLLLDLTTITLYSFAVSFVLFAFFGAYVWRWEVPNHKFYDIVLSSTILPVSIALVITLILTSRSFLQHWRQAAIETERMRAERLAGQYQSLKDQLNPHFLFNSLNVLGNLVYESPERANEFIEKLAAVYRYVLDNQEVDLVPLKTELSFIRSYLDLHKTRFGERMTYTIQVDEPQEYSIPPLTLQLLIENALKHNKATVESPLDINIVTLGGKLSVSNTYQKRDSHEPGSGIGLKNIQERYRFFTDTAIVIEENPNQYIVTVPLLKNPPT